ncbi:hypothetical protein LZC95_13860 [Pendulispora brunnea]|uniref:Uncharacterized protein n=1 Tax=Pendulispora brunnea TaxID=2905690 RepID=A0ABZ2KKS1_9BACT
MDTISLVHPYNCQYQGIAAGWGDDYIAGLDCQWIDITPVAGPRSQAELAFDVNPDRFICEGVPRRDPRGRFLYEPTEFKNEKGETEERIACDAFADANANNAVRTKMDIPQAGGLVDAPCTRGQLGAKRNCGLKRQGEPMACDPGSVVELQCDVADGARPQVYRVCESSRALGAMPCVYGDALAAGTLSGTAVTVKYTCPAWRSDAETGGSVALYTGSVLEEDAPQEVRCKK